MPNVLTDTGYVRQSEFGQNWRLQFLDEQGNTLTMESFEVIDFGAISYKEIFQNVKTILATPLLSAVLERTLGVDWDIIDLPIDKATEATVAIIDALYMWEPRAEPVNIQFESDVISGHLRCYLQLKIKNVIFGTEKFYDRTNISGTVGRLYKPTPKTWEEVEPRVTIIVQRMPPTQGPTGPRGERGSWWFTGTGLPTAIAGAKSQDMYLDNDSGDVYQYDGATWRKRA